MNAQEYDKLIRNSLEGLQGSYKPGAWENMEALMAKEKKKRPFWIFFASLGVVLVATVSTLLVEPFQLNGLSSSSPLPEVTRKQEALPLLKKNNLSNAKREQNKNEGENPSAKIIPVSNNALPQAEKAVVVHHSKTPVIPPIFSGSEDLDDGAVSMSSSSLIEDEDYSMDIEQVDFRDAKAINLKYSKREKGPMDIDEPEFKQWSVNLFAGLSLAPSTTESEKLSQLIPFYVGSEVLYQFSRKNYAGLALQYEVLGLSHNARSIEQNQYIYGYKRQVYDLTDRNVSYLSLAAKMGHKLNPRFDAFIGLQFSRLLQVYSHQTISRSEQDLPQTSTEESLIQGYRAGFNQNQFSILTGLGYKPNSRIRFDLQARFGISSISKTGGSNDQNHLRLGMTYYLWRK